MAIGDEGDITLAGLGAVRLADVRLARPEDGIAAGRPGALAWLATLKDEPVEARAEAAGDRWGRRAARLSVRSGGLPADGARLPEGARSPEGARQDVAELLVDEGLAWADPGERDTLCNPGLLQREQAARLARRGMWAGAVLPLKATEPDALREAAGRSVIVEGIVVSLGERPRVTYLNFGRDFARDFSVVIPKRQWAALLRARPDAARLRGRSVRVRGVIEMRRGPAMEIVATDLIEWDAADAKPRTSGRRPSRAKQGSDDL